MNKNEHKLSAKIYFAIEGFATNENEVFADIAHNYGGWTLSTNTGGYEMASGQYVVETSYSLEIVGDNTIEFRQRIFKTAERFKQIYKQESVMVVFSPLDGVEYI